MNSIIINRLGLVIISILVMMTLLSCTKIDPQVELNEEIIELEINESLMILTNNLMSLAKNIEAEQKFFKEKSIEDDYESFADGLDKTYDQIELEFTTSYNYVVDVLDRLNTNYEGQDVGNQLKELNYRTEAYSVLFRDLLSYHFMILETDVVLSMFNDELINLMNYSSDGNLTSIAYNNELEMVMADYSNLLSVNNEEVLGDQFLNDPIRIEETLESLADAKETIKAISTSTEVDELVNESVYNMFIYIEQSIKVVDKYTQRISKDLYTNNNTLNIEDGCVFYINEILDEIKENSIK